jgi:hypothetical protein
MAFTKNKNSTPTMISGTRKLTKPSKKSSKRSSKKSSKKMSTKGSRLTNSEEDMMQILNEDDNTNQTNQTKNDDKQDPLFVNLNYATNGKTINSMGKLFGITQNNIGNLSQLNPNTNYNPMTELSENLVSQQHMGHQLNQALMGQQFNQPVMGQQFNQPEMVQQFNQPEMVQQFNQPVMGQQFNQQLMGQQFNQPSNASSYQSVSNISHNASPSVMGQPGFQNIISGLSGLYSKNKLA